MQFLCKKHYLEQYTTPDKRFVDTISQIRIRTHLHRCNYIMTQGQIHFKTHFTCTISGDRTPYRPLLCQSPTKQFCVLQRSSPLHGRCMQPLQAVTATQGLACKDSLCSALTGLQCRKHTSVILFSSRKPQQHRGWQPVASRAQTGSKEPPCHNILTGGLSPCSVLLYQHLLVQS